MSHLASWRYNHNIDHQLILQQGFMDEVTQQEVLLFKPQFTEQAAAQDTLVAKVHMSLAAKVHITLVAKVLMKLADPFEVQRTRARMLHNSLVIQVKEEQRKQEFHPMVV